MSRRGMIAAGVIFILIAFVAFLAFQWFQERWRTQISATDEPFVRLAFNMEAAPGNGERLRRQGIFYPRVIQFPNEVCVQLNSNWNYTDGGSIYCFNAADRKATRSFPVRP